MEKDNIYEFCRNYERQIQQVGGIDYMLLGVGYACNIGFNGPGSSANTTTRLVFMDNQFPQGGFTYVQLHRQCAHQRYHNGYFYHYEVEAHYLNGLG